MSSVDRFSDDELVALLREGDHSVHAEVYRRYDYLLDYPYLSVGYSPERLRNPNVKIKNSPFALAFIKNIIAPQENLNDETYLSQALLTHYAKEKYGDTMQDPAIYLRKLTKSYPKRFETINFPLLWLMAQTDVPDLKPQLESLIKVYHISKRFNPEIHEQLGEYFRRNKDIKKAIEFDFLLADSRGFEEQQVVRNACNRLGNYFLSINMPEWPASSFGAKRCLTVIRITARAIRNTSYRL